LLDSPGKEDEGSPHGRSPPARARADRAKQVGRRERSACGRDLLLWSLAVLTCLLVGPAMTATGATKPCLEIEMFSRQGCPHCARAREFLDGLRIVRPDLSIRIRDLGEEPAAIERLVELSRAHELAGVAVPAFSICDVFLVGFHDAATTGQRILSALSAPIEPEGASMQDPSLGWLDRFGLSPERLSVEAIGLPGFTIALGLIDGFNPCAMWVLLILLSVLVGVRDRRKLIVVAGSFVVVSGIAYFAFMAAWLNVFLFIGYSRVVQLALGSLALAVGAIHVKDFFAFKRGVSLSIPESAKPGLYRRMRGIVRAETLGAALAGAVGLAVLVNLVELLCTAGLPALYTQILSMQGLSNAQYYGYLLLYNVAYMFDDALIVSIAVATLHRMKLQERQGRWLKGLSGAVMLVLGAILLLRPDWLMV
jgi:glutaredoxin